MEAIVYTEKEGGRWIPVVLQGVTIEELHQNIQRPDAHVHIDCNGMRCRTRVIVERRPMFTSVDEKSVLAYHIIYESGEDTTLVWSSHKQSFDAFSKTICPEARKS